MEHLRFHGSGPTGYWADHHERWQPPKARKDRPPTLCPIGGRPYPQVALMHDAALAIELERIRYADLAAQQTLREPAVRPNPGAAAEEKAAPPAGG
jgi:hypothetical protein